MQRRKKGFTSVNQYIQSSPVDVRRKLSAMRRLIREAAPQAREKISYQMPTFDLNGNLVHFAAFSKHIGFYPTSSGVRAFERRLTGYKHAKGSIQFPLESPLPTALIKQIVRFRVAENLKRRKGV